MMKHGSEGLKMSRRLGVGVLQLLQPEPDDRGEGHREHGARHAPNGAPKGERNENDERVEVKAMLEQLVLQDAAEPRSSGNWLAMGAS